MVAAPANSAGLTTSARARRFQGRVMVEDQCLSLPARGWVTRLRPRPGRWKPGRVSAPRRGVHTRAGEFRDPMHNVPGQDDRSRSSDICRAGRAEIAPGQTSRLTSSSWPTPQRCASIPPVPEQVCPGVIYETEGVVALVRLDRPERLNAFTYEMI